MPSETRNQNVYYGLYFFPDRTVHYSVDTTLQQTK